MNKLIFTLRCGCDKYLNIFDKTERSRGGSTTYKKGKEHGYSIDFFNLFDMCGEGTDYVTEMSTSMEEESLNLASLAPDKVSDEDAFIAYNILITYNLTIIYLLHSSP